MKYVNRGKFEIAEGNVDKPKETKYEKYNKKIMKQQKKILKCQRKLQSSRKRNKFVKENN